MKLTNEKKLEAISNLRPIDDIFFEVLARHREVVEEILRTILDDQALVVEMVIPQASIRNMYGRSVRLDALCILGNGTRCNIEVQRSDNDNHLRRARYNASSITVKDSSPGDSFSEVIELYIVYISEFDIFNEGLTTYHIDKSIRETGTIVDDGLHELFVNTAINDHTDISELMDCLKSKMVDNPKFPILSNTVKEYKTTDGGNNIMCKVMEDLMKDIIAEKDAEMSSALAEKDNTIIEKNNAIIEKDNAIAAMTMELNRLRKELEKVNSK